jgi:hypothetical protein
MSQENVDFLSGLFAGIGCWSSPWSTDAEARATPPSALAYQEFGDERQALEAVGLSEGT